MSSEIYIKNYDFNKDTTDVLENNKYWTQRPIVYIINNDKEAYIWETIDASIRVNETDDYKTTIIIIKNIININLKRYGIN